MESVTKKIDLIKSKSANIHTKLVNMFIEENNLKENPVNPYVY